jgi:hypothetical protein
MKVIREVRRQQDGNDAKRGYTVGDAQRRGARERLVPLEARGATGIIFRTSSYDVERELRAYAEVAALR